ncbi:MAG: DUF4158 domain-containing protein [Herpetosiphonaceae bacterium]|nr:DUF4158 domain-containing protein [Herpetosiphonaceae bacterium]
MSPPTQRAKRLHLLDAADVAALYDRPIFTAEEQAFYFALTPAETGLMQTWTEGVIQAFFVLQLGYFKAKQRFFTIDLAEVSADLTFICDQVVLDVPLDDLRLPHRNMIGQQRQRILEHFGYRRPLAADRQVAFNLAASVAPISTKPQYLLRIVLQHFAEQRCILPGYTYLQEQIIGKAITTEEQRLTNLLQTHLTPAECDLLESVFEAPDGRYQLTVLRRAPKDFSRGELRRERTRGTDLLPLYDLAPRLLPILAISHEGIAYYAALVGYYGTTRLKDLQSWMVYVYLLAFVQHRYHRLHDNLIGGFMQAVKDYYDEAKAAAKEQVYDYRVELTQDVVRAGQVLQLFTNDQIPPAASFGTVQERAFTLLERERLARAAAYIATGVGCDEHAFHWDHVDTMARRFKGRLRSLLLGVDLSATRASMPLAETVRFLQATFRQGRALTQIDPQTIPTRCIPVRLKRYFYTHPSPGTAQLRLDRFEFLVYQQVRAALEAGDLVCRQSLRFRSIEDDLIPVAEWQAHKDALIAAAKLPILEQPIADHLAELEQALEARFAAVNGRIAAGANTAVTITQTGTTRRWSLQPIKGRDLVNHALFDALPHVSINRVLAFVDQQCGFMQAFEHVLVSFVE